MAADGALSVKVDRDIQIAKIWADAQQRPTPDVTFGGGSSSSSDLGSLMMMSAARTAGIIK